MTPKLTAIEGAYHLPEAHVTKQGEDADYSLYDTELIVRTVNDKAFYKLIKCRLNL